MEYDFEYVAIGETSSDCTTPFKIRFDKKLTLGEFIKQILTKGEWGYIEIGKDKIEYRGNIIISPNPFLIANNYDKTINECYASGGWSRMDYDIVLDDEEVEQNLVKPSN